MVSSLWPPAVLGGAELYASKLADHLEERGHTVGVVTLGVDGPRVVAKGRPWPYRLDDFADSAAWRRVVFHLRDLYDPTAARLIRRAITSFAPDVVHSHAIAGLSAAVLSAPDRMGVPHVHHVHDYWLLCRRTTMVRGSGVACEQRCLSCRSIAAVHMLTTRGHVGDVCVAVSEATADVHRELRALRSPVRVVHNAGAAAPPTRPPRATGAAVVF
ncbi:MAG: hypothetical protein QOE63_1610, partial [Acidimicrobiaceae bacterium]